MGWFSAGERVGCHCRRASLVSVVVWEDNGGMGSVTDRVLLLAVALVALAGVFDAIIIRQYELILLFAVILGMAFVLLARSFSKRRALRVRADLAKWLIRRSNLTGESAEQIADRALATYRLQLGEELQLSEEPDAPDPPTGR